MGCLNSKPAGMSTLKQSKPYKGEAPATGPRPSPKGPSGALEKAYKGPEIPLRKASTKAPEVVPEVRKQPTILASPILERFAPNSPDPASAPNSAPSGATEPLVPSGEVATRISEVTPPPLDPPEAPDQDTDNNAPQPEATKELEDTKPVARGASSLVQGCEEKNQTPTTSCKPEETPDALVGTTTQQEGQAEATPEGSEGANLTEATQGNSSGQDTKAEAPETPVHNDPVESP